MRSKKINAIVIGSTGATGSALIKQLISMPDCDSVITIGRRSNMLFENNPKVKQYILPNMLDISSFDQSLLTNINMAFCCIGTTFNDVFKKSKASEYQNVDFGIATGFATLAKSSGADFFAVITGDKSDSKSRHRMTRVKGETEDFVKSLNFNRLAILRPGLLNRGNGKRGILEQILTVNGTFGLPVEKLGKAMIWMSQNQQSRITSYETSDIKNVLKMMKDKVNK